MTTQQKPDPATLGARALDDDTIAEPIERAALTGALERKGVAFDPETPTEGLRELWQMFGGGEDPRAGELEAEIERKRQNEETTEPKRQVEAEPEPTPIPGELAPGETAEQARDRLVGEIKQTGTTTVINVGDIDKASSALFNAGTFDDPRLILETEDGERIDSIIVKITGSLTLDRKSPEAVELFRALKRGRQVALTIRTAVTGDATELKRNGDDELIEASRKLKVWRLDTAKTGGREHVLSAIGGGERS
jgi:hypothetical protein